MNKSDLCTKKRSRKRLFLLWDLKTKGTILLKLNSLKIPEKFRYDAERENEQMNLDFAHE